MIECILALLTAVMGFAGGMLILMRSGEGRGRALALGLIFLALAQCGGVAYARWHWITIIPWVFLCELAAVSVFLIALEGMERRLAQKRTLRRRTQLISITVCVLYGSSILVAPALHVKPSSSGIPVLGVLGLGQSLVILAGALISIWIVENILRFTGEDQKRLLKYPALGLIAIETALLIGAIYRIGTHTFSHDLFTLTALIMLVGMSVLIFFAVRFKLFDMDIFISRYVVYHSITLLSAGLYLTFTGLIIIGVQRIGLRSSFVVTGFLVFAAAVMLLALILSRELRARLRFFINTHFFANKYDYRKEWGELSRDLSIALTEKQILHVTAQVILDSMYIRELGIWLHEETEFRSVLSFPHPLTGGMACDHPFIAYLETHPYFLCATPCTLGDESWERITTDWGAFLAAHAIVLAVPMTIGKTMIGFIAVGQENPGHRYGHDDIDLLQAIASQFGGTLMRGRFAQELAENKEIDTYTRMSAALLHDLKNAAGHLSLILQNAPAFIDQKEFQQDMMETITQALARIDKVIKKLGRFPEQEALTLRTVRIGPFLQTLVDRLRPRLAAVKFQQDIEDGLEVLTDPDLLERMVENLIVNACEAVSSDGEIALTAVRSPEGIAIHVADNGPGIPDQFVREHLFKPFQTTKPNGTGLGLWQVKNMAQQLGARIEVDHHRTQGVAFGIILPAQTVSRESGVTRPEGGVLSAKETEWKKSTS